ncbi:hypothetical protein Fcan01_22397, partial [Folsomia candida]
QSFELENSPFVVVEFCHDKTVGIVHEKWITKVENNTYAYWPPFWKDNRKLKKGVLSGEVLNPTSWRLSVRRCPPEACTPRKGSRNQSSDEDGVEADMDSGDEGYPKLVLVGASRTTSATEKNQVATSSQNSSANSLPRRPIIPVGLANEESLSKASTPRSSLPFAIRRARPMHDDDAFETQMIRKVDFLTASVIHLNDSVQLLLNRQTNTQNTSSTRTRQFNLPITNIEDWKALEEKLKLGDKTLPPENNDDKHVRINDVRAK